MSVVFSVRLLLLIYCTSLFTSVKSELNECQNFTAFSWEAYAGELFHARSHVYEGNVEEAKASFRPESFFSRPVSLFHRKRFSVLKNIR